MNYSEPLAHQYNVFLVFLGVGFILGFVYETVVFIRTLLSRKKFAIIIQDVLFSFLTFLTLFFSFLAFSNGVIRFNLILSCAAGFLTFELSAGRAVKKLFGILQKLFQKTVDILLKPFAAVSAFAVKKAEKTKSKIIAFANRIKKKKKTESDENSTEAQKAENGNGKIRKPILNIKRKEKPEPQAKKENKIKKNSVKRKSKSKIYLKK